jgi:hypothetical protein
VSESLAERERMNTSLNEQIQQLTNELRVKQDEFQQIQKSLNKQVKYFVLFYNKNKKLIYFS